MTLEDRKQKISTANPMDSGSRNYRKENSERAGYPSFELLDRMIKMTGGEDKMLASPKNL